MRQTNQLLTGTPKNTKLLSGRLMSATNLPSRHLSTRIMMQTPVVRKSLLSMAFQWWYWALCVLCYAVKLWTTGLWWCLHFLNVQLGDYRLHLQLCSISLNPTPQHNTGINNILSTILSYYIQDRFWPHYNIKMLSMFWGLFENVTVCENHFDHLSLHQ